MEVLGQEFQKRTEEEKDAMRTERKRKKELNKIYRKQRKGKLSAATARAEIQSMYNSDTDPLAQKSPAEELEMRRQASSGRKKMQENLEAGAKAIAKGTSMVVGGVPGAVIGGVLEADEAMQSGEDPGKAFLKSMGKSALNAFGGQMLAKGEQAFLTSRAMKEADRLSLAEMNFDDGLIDQDALTRRTERFIDAQVKANQGTTALGDLARGLDKTGLFNKLVQGNNIIQSDSGIDPQAAAVADPAGPAYTPQPDPFMVNTLYNPLTE